MEKKTRIAEGEDELFRRAEWIADDVDEYAAGRSAVLKMQESRKRKRRRGTRADRQRDLEGQTGGRKKKKEWEVCGL